jgi:hypothetical protein
LARKATTCESHPRISGTLPRAHTQGGCENEVRDKKKKVLSEQFCFFRPSTWTRCAACRRWARMGGGAREPPSNITRQQLVCEQNGTHHSKERPKKQRTFGVVFRGRGRPRGGGTKQMIFTRKAEVSCKFWRGPARLCPPMGEKANARSSFVIGATLNHCTAALSFES